ITSLAFKSNKEGNTVGKVYFFNVLGNLAGGLVTGLLLLVFLGTEYSILLLSFLGILFIFFIEGRNGIYRLEFKILIILSIIFLTITFFPRKNQLYSNIHPNILFNRNERKIIKEGLDGVIVTYSDNDKLSTYINGLTHGGRPNPLFSFEAIEALSYNNQIKNALIIGFGTGTTTETLLKLEPKPRIVLVELSKALIENLRQIEYLESLLQNDHLDLIFTDGRKYLYNNKEKFDIILIDPLRTTTSYSNNLYSKQFFNLVKGHLTTNGVFMIWMDEYHVMPKTICSVFSYVRQYGFFCIASNRELKQNIEFKYAFFRHFPGYQEALIRLDSIENNPLTRDNILSNNIEYPINEDYRPRCEYYIGLHFLRKK
ncbi:methyltransferase, partial [Dolichospermum sp. ST_sed3]|nr:methyltransferase [Dolichospermum sp. ST_sed3]